MKFLYILKKDLKGSVAANLVAEFNKAIGDVFIIKNDKIIKGKSLIGLLTILPLKNEQIIIEINNLQDAELISSAMVDLGILI
jgi:phosphotransferase system HPr-like phosphotransfer protein